MAESEAIGQAERVPSSSLGGQDGLDIERQPLQNDAVSSRSLATSSSRQASARSMQVPDADGPALQRAETSATDAPPEPSSETDTNPAATPLNVPATSSTVGAQPNPAASAPVSQAAYEAQGDVDDDPFSSITGTGSPGFGLPEPGDESREPGPPPSISPRLRSSRATLDLASATPPPGDAADPDQDVLLRPPHEAEAPGSEEQGVTDPKEQVEAAQEGGAAPQPEAEPTLAIGAGVGEEVEPELGADAGNAREASAQKEGEPAEGLPSQKDGYEADRTDPVNPTDPADAAEAKAEQPGVAESGGQQEQRQLEDGDPQEGEQVAPEVAEDEGRLPTEYDPSGRPRDGSAGGAPVDGAEAEGGYAADADDADRGGGDAGDAAAAAAAAGPVGEDPGLQLQPQPRSREGYGEPEESAAESGAGLAEGPGQEAAALDPTGPGEKEEEPGTAAEAVVGEADRTQAAEVEEAAELLMVEQQDSGELVYEPVYGQGDTDMAEPTAVGAAAADDDAAGAVDAAEPAYGSSDALPAEDDGGNDPTDAAPRRGASAGSQPATPKAEAEPDEQPVAEYDGGDQQPAVVADGTADVGAMALDASAPAAETAAEKEGEVEAETPAAEEAYAEDDAADALGTAAEPEAALEAEAGAGSAAISRKGSAAVSRKSSQAPSDMALESGGAAEYGDGEQLEESYGGEAGDGNADDGRAAAAPEDDEPGAAPNEGQEEAADDAAVSEPVRNTASQLGDSSLSGRGGSGRSSILKSRTTTRNTLSSVNSTAARDAASSVTDDAEQVYDTEEAEEAPGPGLEQAEGDGRTDAKPASSRASSGGSRTGQQRQPQSPQQQRPASGEAEAEGRSTPPLSPVLPPISSATAKPQPPPSPPPSQQQQHHQHKQQQPSTQQAKSKPQQPAAPQSQQQQQPVQQPVQGAVKSGAQPTPLKETLASHDSQDPESITQQYLKLLHAGIQQPQQPHSPPPQQQQQQQQPRTQGGGAGPEATGQDGKAPSSESPARPNPRHQPTPQRAKSKPQQPAAPQGPTSPTRRAQGHGQQQPKPRAPQSQQQQQPAQGAVKSGAQPGPLREMLSSHLSQDPESITQQYLKLLHGGALLRPNTAPEGASGQDAKSAAGSGAAAAMALSAPGSGAGRPGTGHSAASGASDSSNLTAHGLELARLQARTAWEVAPLERPRSSDENSGGAAAGRKLPPLSVGGGAAAGGLSPKSTPGGGSGGGGSTSPNRFNFKASRQDVPSRVFTPRPNISAAPYQKMYTPGPGSYSPTVFRQGDSSSVGGATFGGGSPPRAWAFGSARQRPPHVCLPFPDESPGPVYVPSKDGLSTSPGPVNHRFDRNLPGGRFSLTAGAPSNAPLFNPGPGAYEAATNAAGDPLSPGGSGAMPAFSFARTRKLMGPATDGAALPVLSREHVREYYGTLSPGPAHYSPDTSPTRTAVPAYTAAGRRPCWFDPAELSPGPIYKPNDLDRTGGHSLGDKPHATIGKAPKMYDPTGALSASPWLSFNHARRVNYGIYSPGPVYLPNDPRVSAHVPSPVLATGAKDRFTGRDEPGRLQ